MRVVIAALCLPALLVSSASAQLRVIITDRTQDSAWLLNDINGDFVITEPDELVRWYGPGNASALPGVLNPNNIGFMRNAVDGLVLIGDQDSSARKIYWTRDGNSDGDAMDEGEAGVFADLSSGAGQWFAFPTGITFDAAGVPVVVNAGNGFGPDSIWRCNDLNSDKDANDAGETTALATVNGFSTSNGSYSPQEVAFDADGAIMLRNSSANLHGVWRIKDTDGNGIADQPSEFALWYGLGNAAGFTMSAGFAIDNDLVRPGAFYYQSVASGGVDEIYRLRDNNNDGDAQDDGEAVLVYTTSETGFTIIDVASLADGSLLVTDNSGKRVFRLVDRDGDDKFLAANERDVFLAASSTFGDVRNLAIVRDVQVCQDIDFNNNGVFPEDQDVVDFFDVLAGGSCAACNTIDFNNNGVFPEDQDVIDFFNVLAGGNCP
ncbi:MAG TPA: hypothetical protein VK157_09420 [Phycisphaerales bacterium]|nr:hypothetical protein [Phycisphaerales bacterium]